MEFLFNRSSFPELLTFCKLCSKNRSFGDDGSGILLTHCPLCCSSISVETLKGSIICCWNSLVSILTVLMMMMMMTVVNSRHDIVNVYLRDKCPEWIRNRHPSGGVPILETDDGRVLYESLVCAQYADDANPQSRLTPADPFTKAKHSLLICEWDKVCFG